MLYQSMSGDAEEGKCTLTLEDTSIQDNGGISMFLITNTTAEVYVKNCKFLNSKGKELSESDTAVLCKNCNTKERQWGKEGSNGGKVYLNFENQALSGKICAAEKDSFIQVADSKNSALKLKKQKGKGTVKQ